MRSPPSPDEIRSWVRYEPETGRFFRLADAGRWYRAGGELVGTVNSEGYRKLSYRGRPLSAARIAFLLMTGAWPSHTIDHINGRRDDNRWVNLRPATKAQNCQNKAVIPGSTGFRGVVRDHKNATNPYLARITFKGTKHHLGSFPTAAAASEAYQQAASQLFGGFSTDRR